MEYSRRQLLHRLSFVFLSPMQFFTERWSSIFRAGKYFAVASWLSSSESPAQVATSASSPSGQNPNVILSVDAASGRQEIHPEIYGVLFATTADLKANNAPLNRQGGCFATTYNWQLNASNHTKDWYFESREEPGGDQPGAYVDAVIENSRAAGADVMVTIPTMGWVAKLDPERRRLWSYSIKKYGPQTGHDPGDYPDAGNGFRAVDHAPIENNDPTDANQRATPEFQRGWVEHLVRRWGKAADGGVRYYLMDNEPSIWYYDHCDVVKTGPSAAIIRDKIIAYAAMIREIDPDALIAGPEEWGWNALFYSGLDQQWGQTQKQLTGKFPGPNASFPDRKACGGMEYIAWLLKELNAYENATGVRLLDAFTCHCYPQNGEFSDDVSPATQLKRNRSTRLLWDPNYNDPSSIHGAIRFIPRMRELVTTYYPGRTIGITEYDWGAVDHINGATAQADVLGIFGREGLNFATREQIGIHGINNRENLDLDRRWTPAPGSTLADKAFQMYRNYDGQRSTFGDTRVRITNSADVDNLAAFGAQRSSDGALTIMLVAKRLTGATSIDLGLSNFTAVSKAELWQLTATNRITRLENIPVNLSRLTFTVPAQSITLLVIPQAGGTRGGF